jgi:hypothetical protein
MATREPSRNVGKLDRRSAEEEVHVCQQLHRGSLPSAQWI